MFEGAKPQRYGNWLIEIFPAEGGYEATISHEDLTGGGPDNIKGSYLTVAEAKAAAIQTIHVRVAVDFALLDWINEMTQKGVLSWDDFPNGAFPEISSMSHL